MVELNKTVNWKPKSTGEGRFGNWLENMVDWNLSRSRFWGTPLPIWRTEEGDEEICIGSIEELNAGIRKANEVLGGDVNKHYLHEGILDLHKPYVDDIILVSPSGKPMKRVPDLIDVSFRQAEAMLQSFGLVTGDVIYRSDLAKNAVLGQLYKNKTIKPGTMVPKGAVIDLILGDGLGDPEINVPDITGMTLDDARVALSKTRFTIGEIHLDPETNDTTSAKIYLQKPSPDYGNARQGNTIEAYLR